MGKGATKGQVQHFQPLVDGRTGCWIWNCGRPATRWIDMERYGIRRWLSTAYCDGHGEWPSQDPHHAHRLREFNEDEI
ncbi:hypothetical protein M1P56_09765 [Streptomyces sp. HU2014]|uniref:hypothetical protein n=1 Tax=Streptomyces sp. HU2014 TaxID=2939414 RepID=UPI0020104641|nr:hypothetical protein [Streptomyces sp. HU2014]UQI44612.1 hypothetical protein M1P56_09765 [Streptomyces sp. HU2014]